MSYEALGFNFWRLGIRCPVQGNVIWGEVNCLSGHAFTMKYALIKDERLGYTFATNAYCGVQTTNIQPTFPLSCSNVISCYE